MSLQQTDTEFDDPRLKDSETGAGLVSEYPSATELNPDLMGRRAFETYDKMRKGDSSVRTSLRVIKAPLLAAQWYVEPANDTELDKDTANFIDAALNGMSRTLEQYLWEALLMLDFGYYAFEKVFTTATFRPDRAGARARNVTTWKKWGPRHPLNTTGWSFDAHGGVQALKQRAGKDLTREVRLPIEDLMIFTLDEEAGNPEGISILRSAYSNWYIKNNLYKVDAIQKERHGIGIPRVKLMENYDTDDKTLARTLVQNLRTNEKAGVVEPPNIVVDFIEPKGNQVDVLESIRHHDLMIKSNVLAQFLALGTGESGSRAVGSVQEDIFIKSIHYVADLVCAVINKWAIPQLVNFNFDVEEYPTLKVRRIGDLTDMRALSIALRNMVEVGAMTVDPETEIWLRDYLDFPAPTSAALGRTMEQRMEKTPAQRTGENVADRPDMPSDGG